MRELNREDVIRVIAQSIAVADDEDWRTLHQATRDELVLAAKDVLDALAAAGMAVVMTGTVTAGAVA